MWISPARSATATVLVASQVQPVTRDNAIAAFQQLQTWYNHSTGLWTPSTGWWNSVTVITDLATINPSIASEVESIIAETFRRAPESNAAITKTIDDMYLPTTFYSDHGPPAPAGLNASQPPSQRPPGSFLNSYYDDEGWWALAWLRAHALAPHPAYLLTAERLFADMAAAYDTTPCGGLWWDKAHTYVNSIVNALYLSVAAHLVAADGTVNDGLDLATCANNGGTVWSYNAGVLVGGLARLAVATGEAGLVVAAEEIADAAMGALADGEGILHDVCEPECGADGSQFKGIFVRGLVELWEVCRREKYREFLRRNGESIWGRARAEGTAELGLVWSGPAGVGGRADASTQSSALDGLVGVLVAGLG